MMKSLTPILLSLPAALLAQTFEVASVKPAGPLNPMMVMSGQQRVGMKVDGARVDIANWSLADLIRTAYAVKAFQVSGPDWISRERYNVVAKLPTGAAPDQVSRMLQALLADRFKLAFHRESKEHSVYALVAGKGGVRLKESSADSVPPPPPPDGPGDHARMASLLTDGPMGPVNIAPSGMGTMRLSAVRVSTATLADMLSRFLDRVVVDQTGLKGEYDVSLDLSMDEMRNVAKSAGISSPGMAPNGEMARHMDSDGNSSGPSIFQSLQDMGLKLENRKAPVEVIVVDRAEKSPAEN
jgi:uncharacterized protein (TIGR03435 family)